MTLNYIGAPAKEILEPANNIGAPAKNILEPAKKIGAPAKEILEPAKNICTNNNNLKTKSLIKL